MYVMKKILIIPIILILLIIPISITLFTPEQENIVTSKDSKLESTLPTTDVVPQNIQMHEEVRVAFIGDQGFGPDAIAVLNLIKDENAEVVLHQGDLYGQRADWSPHYEDNPDEWENLVSGVLGNDFPYIVSIGHHDVKKWDEYQQKFYDRLKKNSDVICKGDLGVKSSCTYKDIFFIQTAPGVLRNDDTDYNAFIENQLENNEHVWKICSWAYTMQKMQIGSKNEDSTGWDVYETCKNHGAIIANAHEHSYHRTKTLIDIQNQIVNPEWSEPNRLKLSEGSTFTFVSGLGGHSVRDQDRCLPTSYPYGCNQEWAKIYTTDQNATFGALFCTFNAAGNSDKAYCYFKNIHGQIVDEFTITNSLGMRDGNTDLIDSDMSEKNLSGKDFSNLVFIDANLSNTLLREANLSNTILTGTILRGADMTDANLMGVSFLDKDLTGTILRGADMTDANLMGTNLSDKDLTGTILRGANLSEANLTGIDLSDKDLTGTILRGTNLSDKDLTGTILRGANLSNSILPSTFGSFTSAESADLANANFDGVNLSGKTISKSSFNSASFVNSDLTNMDISDTTLNKIDFTNIKNKSFMGTELYRNGMTHSNFSGINFDNAQITRVNAHHSNFSEIDFTNIKNKSIHTSVFAYSNFENSNFSGLDFTTRDDEGNIILNTIPISRTEWESDLKFKNLGELSREIHDRGALADLPIGLETIPGTDEVALINGSFHILTVSTVWFEFANLTNADFSNTDLEYVIFKDADLTNTDFTNANLAKAYFGGADFTNANLSGAIMSGQQLSCKQLDQVKQDISLSNGVESFSIAEVKEISSCE